MCLRLVIQMGESVKSSAIFSGKKFALCYRKGIALALRAVGFHVRVSLIPKKNGKLRLVFNTEPLNCFIVVHGFEIATLKVVARSLALEILWTL